jgi:hypothetical protein
MRKIGELGIPGRGNLTDVKRERKERLRRRDLNCRAILRKFGNASKKSLSQDLSLITPKNGSALVSLLGSVTD